MTDMSRVAAPLAEALAKRDYTALTPVQQAVIAAEADDVDILVSAQTGSGKTVAFGLALAKTLLGDASRLPEAGAPLAVAIAPTRELALQVKRELEWLYEATGAQVASCVGGMDMRSERRALERGAHIVVGTPGRLRDHITRGSLDLSSLRAVVLDEADEMLDLGFREDLEFILDAAPAERRTLLFSATIPRAIATLAKTYQRDALRISTTGEQSQHGDIEYRALTVVGSDRDNAIVNVLRYYEAKTALVFCSTRAAVNHMTARFNNRGFSVVALSGELSQSERTHALQAMRDGRARVCVATDVAARGIDLPDLELVIHADLPTNPDTLKHRSGRTGRAGRKGVSVLIVPLSARRRTERLLQGASIKAVWAAPPSAEEVSRRDDERLLADPSLGEAVAEDEQALVSELLDRHGAEKVAAAFVRVFRSGRSAPEELTEIVQAEARGAPKERTGDFAVGPSGPREDFGEGVWFSLSIGRNQNAEPRWLIPMLCRAGNITKREIGAIRMQQQETFVQIAAEAADGFAEAVGPKKMLDRGVRLRRLEGAPVLGRPSHGGAKRFADRQPAEAASKGDHGPREKKPWSKPSFKDKPGFKKKQSFENKPSFKDKPPRSDRSDAAAEPKPKKRKPKA